MVEWKGIVMFDKIIYISDHSANIKLREDKEVTMNLMNMHLVFEDDVKKVLGEVDDLDGNIVKARFLGEIVNGKLIGGAYRVPVIDGSMIEVTVELKNLVNVEMINEAFKKNANETLMFTTDPIVSSDIIGCSCGALVDGLLTSVLDDNNKQLVKVVAWYDNEFGYTSQMLNTAKKMFR